MIISVADFKNLVSTDASNDVLEAKLGAMEAMIRQYTNNRFIRRDINTEVVISGTSMVMTDVVFSAGDTIDINGRVLVISSIDGTTATLSTNPRMAGTFKAYLVEYPKDVVNGVVNLMKWDLVNGDKTGIKSETLSRYSVTYYDMDASAKLGYPASLVGFMSNYRRARV